MPSFIPPGQFAPLSRRRFLWSSIIAAAGLPLCGRVAFAGPLDRRTRRMVPAAWLPDPPPVESLRAMALAAMDAATHAGADFADIRLGFTRFVDVPQYPYVPMVGLTVGYGIRASVNGTWSFQHGERLTFDAITTAARSAVAGARIYAGVNARLSAISKRPPASEWAPVPVVTGEWHAPMEIDPFTVSIDDYHRVMGAMTATTADVAANVHVTTGGLEWNAETRVFASTAGSLITQTRMQGGPGTGGTAVLPDDAGDDIPIDIPGMGEQVGGFEVALRPDWVPRFMAGIDEAIRLRELPLRPFSDIGRFPVVFARNAACQLLGKTMSAAVDGDRAAGLERATSGTTFLSPLESVLDASAPQFSPLFTVQSGRALPSTTAVGWDDEGVAPETYTVIDRGRVVDYHTTRETAPRLAAWYQKQGRPVRSHGTTVATSPLRLPLGSPGHVTVTPSSARDTIDDLTRDMTHGFVVYGGNTSVDAGLDGGVVFADRVVEVRKGVPVSRTQLLIQFVTKRLLRTQCVALGDASTVRTANVEVQKGIPWQDVGQPISVPAVRCNDVDVVLWDLRP